MNARRAARAAALLVLLAAAGAAQAQSRVQCESRDYRYQFCGVGGLEGAWLVEQRSRSACIEGRTWGWDRRGVWVDQGCEGVFDVQVARSARREPAPARAFGVTCESRDYQYEFCPVPDTIVVAQLVTQRSRSACVEGRTWGWRPNGIWVSGGCEADFQYRSAADVAPIPAPAPSQGVLYCESRDYAYTFCPTGRLRNAELVAQRSQATCVYGQTWGFQSDGVWVDRGCAAEFAIRPR